MGPFATAAELGEYVGITPPSDLARWQAHLDAASSLIRGFTGQTLTVVTNDSVVLEAIDREIIVLPERPVTAIASITVSGSAFTSYRFTRAGLIHNSTGADWSNGATVVYTHGYAETTAEYALFRTICLDVAARSLLLNMSGNPGGSAGVSQSMGGFVMETAGFAPTAFLTDGERMQLATFGAVLVG